MLREPRWQSGQQYWLKDHTDFQSVSLDPIWAEPYVACFWKVDAFAWVLSFLLLSFCKLIDICSANNNLEEWWGWGKKGVGGEGCLCKTLHTKQPLHGLLAFLSNHSFCFCWFLKKKILYSQQAVRCSCCNLFKI